MFFALAMGKTNFANFGGLENNKQNLIPNFFLAIVLWSKTKLSASFQKNIIFYGPCDF